MRRSSEYLVDYGVSKNEAVIVARRFISVCDRLGATLDPTSAYSPIRPWMSSNILSQVTAAEYQPADLKVRALRSASASASFPWL